MSMVHNGAKHQLIDRLVTTERRKMPIVKPPAVLPANHSAAPPVPPRFRNRLPAVLEHIPIYSFEGQARLAKDAGIARSSMSRLIKGNTAPSYRLICAVTAAIERRLGRRIDPRDLVTDEATFPTPFVCSLMECPGCLPTSAYDEEDNLKAAFYDVDPGRWSGAEETGPVPAEEAA
jgi:transcriptional regulator with XRE-family HTH domain